MAKRNSQPASNLLKKNAGTIHFDPEDLRPQNILSKKENILIGLFVFAFTLIIYMLTNAKSLSFWDAGEYISCSSILGVPHPPGNPFYIMLGRFFCVIGIGLPHAAIVSFVSSLLSAFAVLFTYLFTVQILSMTDKNKYLVAGGGIIAAFLTAFSYTFWMNAIEAEVYAGLAFVINLAVWMTMVWVKKQRDFSHQNILLIIIYVLFLGFCIHQTSLQVAPALLFICVYPFILPYLKRFNFWAQVGGFTFALLVLYIIFNQIGKATNVPVLEKFVVGAGFFLILYYYLRNLVSNKVWLFAFLLILLGFSPHLYLLIRSESRPFINEGHPHNFELFMDYILRRQYGDFSFMVRRAAFFKEQVGYHFLRYFSWQFLNVETVSGWFKTPQVLFQLISNLLVTTLGMLGFYHTFKKNKHSFAYLTSIFFMVSLAMIFVINLSDKEVRDRDYFFTTAYNFWAVAMGIGAVGLIRLFDFSKAKKMVQTVLLALLILYPFVNLSSQYFVHNRTGELVSLDYGLNLLNSLEKDAIIFTNGDNDTFPLWYAQAVKDPYAIEFVHPARDTNPTNKTNELIRGAMDYKNKECAGIRKDVTVANLSLLNTPWYIRQLRDKEGVEFNVEDRNIDQLMPIRLDSDSEVQIGDPKTGQSFIIKLAKDTPLLVKDYAVIQIIKDNFGKRPIYFAVTCSETSGFDKHLRNEGMVDRVVIEELAENIDAERLEKNLTKVYQYRGIFNDKLYKDENMTRLVTNYGAAFMRLSDHYKRQKNYDKSINLFEQAIRFISEPEQERFLGLKTLLYVEAGKAEQAEKEVLAALEKNPANSQLLIQLAYAMIRSNYVDKGFKYLERAAAITPADVDLASLIVQAAVAYNQRDRGIKILTTMVPHQAEAQEYIKYLRDPEFTLDKTSFN
jgi:tetratricopeptide (TPR) repeat protein